MAGKSGYNFFARLITTTLAALLTAYLLPGVFIDNVLTAVLLSLVLAVLNGLVKPILVILTLPITIVTLGLFLFVINAAMILLADEILSGFRIDGFWIALLFSIVLSIVVSILEALQQAFTRK